MQTIALSDSSNTYLELLQKITSGEEVIVTSQTNLATKIAPVTSVHDRELAKQKLITHLESKNFIKANWTREELYD